MITRARAGQSNGAIASSGGRPSPPNTDQQLAGNRVENEAPSHQATALLPSPHFDNQFDHHQFVRGLGGRREGTQNDDDNEDEGDLHEESQGELEEDEEENEQDQEEEEEEEEEEDEEEEDDDEGIHPPQNITDEEDMDEGFEDEQDSLYGQPESEVAQRALTILRMDERGHLLPISYKEEDALHAVWLHAGSGDLSGLHPTFNSPLDPNSPKSPDWFKRLSSEVLVRPPTNQVEEAALVKAIQQNLLNIVNSLSDDEWMYPTPSAFLPSGNNVSNASHAHIPDSSEEDYLQTEFNPRSLASFIPSTPYEASFYPPRQLWLGEDEDEGVDSEASLADLLNTTLARGGAELRSSNLPGRWDVGSSARRPRPRQAPGSALARQVSRLGVAE